MPSFGHIVVLTAATTNLGGRQQPLCVFCVSGILLSILCVMSLPQQLYGAGTVSV